ncbi:MAG: hypothetical protein E7617_01230 [Ruminococcaceae bacterium]|nr:hypothetical protein [Oscillospiraceae bacterium]
MEKYAIVIAGISGVGKTTVADRLIEDLGYLEMSRSATTRSPRGDGRDDEYVYITEEEFRRSIAEGGVAEYTEYGGNLYGTRKCELERIFDSGKHPILVLDYNGAASLKKSLDYPVYAFYVYTDLAIAEERLRLRDLASGCERARASFEKRCRQNIDDFSVLHTMAELFDCYVENEEVGKCASEIIAAIDKLRCGEEAMSLFEKVMITEDFRRKASERLCT